MHLTECQNHYLYKMKEIQTIDVVCAVIRRGGKYFLARRASGKAQGGYWEFPGGKTEAGENEEDSLRREIQEELDMEIEVVSHIATSEYRYPEKNIRLSAWYCKSDSRYTLRDHDMAGWFTSDEIKRLTVAPADVFILDYLA